MQPLDIPGKLLHQTLNQLTDVSLKLHKSYKVNELIRYPFSFHLIPAGETWITLFSVFFPASTGIMAGANISGDLKDAQKAIPTGTLWAVGVSGLTYVAMIWTLAATCLRTGGRGGLYEGKSICCVM